MGEKFKGRYQVSDGYVGDRPKYVTINADDLEEDMSDDELLQFYEEEIQNHFEQNVSADAERCDEFVAWAREQLNKRDA